MRYLPHTREDMTAMLKVAGVQSVDGLFSAIPKDCQYKEALNLPEPMTEWELNALLSDFASQMAVPTRFRVFLGAGSYEHFIPATLPYLLSRSGHGGGQCLHLRRCLGTGGSPFHERSDH